MGKYVPINGWTRARIIEKLREKMPERGQALDEFSGVCVFRDERGNACALGAFIPDGHKALMGNGSPYMILNVYSDLADIFPLRSTALQLLQNTHDTARCERYTPQPVDLCVQWVLDNVKPDKNELEPTPA